MSDLKDALRSKKETRAAKGAEDAQKAATQAVWERIGRSAEQHDRDERPRRKQTNIDLPEGLKREFKAQVQKEGLQMRFVLEDLIRLYLDHTK